MLCHALCLLVRGKGWERSGRGNPSGLIREQSVNPVGAACRGHGTSPGSCICLHHASSRLTWWPMRSRAVPGTDLDIPTTASAYATFTPPGYCRHHVHAGKCFLRCFSFLLNDINCGLALRHKRCMKLNFWLVSPDKQLMIGFSLMLSCSGEKETIPFPSASHHFLNFYF